MKIKMIMMVAVAMVAVLLNAAESTAAYAKAIGSIDKVIAEPAKITATMKTLSSAEQVSYVAEVGKAVAELPASVNDKAAKLVSLTHLALKAANKGNVSAVISEVVATYPVEVLPAVCERIGTDLINRAANPNATYTDAQFTEIALDLMKKVNERTEKGDNSAVRSTFAIVMLTEASNGTPADLADKLVETLPEGSREIARTEWLPAATGKDGQAKSYDSMLASADAGTAANPIMVLDIAGPQMLDSVLADMTGDNTDPSALINGRTPVVDAVTSHLDRQSPVLVNTVSEQGRASQPAGGDANPITGPSEKPGPSEPSPYQWQSL